MASKNKKAKTTAHAAKNVNPAAEDQAQTKPAEILPSETAKTESPQTNEPEKKADGKSKAKKPKAEKPPKVSALDAAAKVLAEAGRPMNTKEMIDAMTAQKYWTSPNGLTPHATLYSAIAREINTKGAQTRFRKAEKGRFALA